MKKAINLLKGDTKGAETDYRDAMPINVSAVLKPMFGADGYMLQQQGLTQYAAGVGIDRGGIYNERLSRHFRVSGSNFVTVGRTGVVTDLGNISGIDTASLPYSFTTQGILASGRFYLYSISAGLSSYTDTDIGVPIDCVWVDGYYFFTDGEYIYHTDINDETAIDPLKFATSEFSPDPTYGLAKTTDNKVVVFNRYSTEYFVNDASSNFSFQRLATRALKIGIVGTHCKCEMLDKFWIMGGRKEESVSIHYFTVGSITNVASREVDKLIANYTEIELSSVVLEPRVINGYPYLIVHLPNETLLYSAKVGAAVGHENAWSIIKSDVVGNDQWRGKHGVFDPKRGEWVYGDKIDGRIGYLDDLVATQYGDIVECVLNTPFDYIDTASIDELEIETIAGFTTTEDASVFVSLTYNGVTHGTEHSIQYGGPSEYGKRFIARRMGYIRDWFSLKLRWASRSRMAFSRAMIDYG